MSTEDNTNLGSEQIDPMLREFDPGANDEPLSDELVDGFSEFGREVVDTVKDIPESIKEFAEDIKGRFTHHETEDTSDTLVQEEQRATQSASDIDTDS
ncbi:MAG: hypothetical protein QM632_05595 [Micrococcaceae bacterium]